jgi:uracil-DNA glycosylase family 4
MSTKQVELDKITQQMLDDKVCPQLAATATQLVPGEGSADAEVVFVGEAPGKEEDKQGRPFVGAAGKLLDFMLNNINLRREDVFITNIVKYRPPNNRDPQPAEIAAFLPYLKKQLSVINPVLIIPLGRHALSVLLPGLSISVCHGQPKRKNGRLYLPLYHPAVALYNNFMKATLAADFEVITILLKKYAFLSKAKQGK